MTTQEKKQLFWIIVMTMCAIGMFLIAWHVP